jgi:hypothetical protein
MRTLSKMFATVAAIALSAGLSAGTALAATAPVAAKPASQKVHEVRIVMPMKVVGFDAKVAKAHGYEIRTYHGRQYSVKIGTPRSVIPNVTVGGNCGSSYIDYNAQGNRVVFMETGFHVYLTATNYSWWVYLLDNGGLSNHHWWGIFLLPHQNWGTSALYGGMTPGGSSAWVSTPSSYADLISGARCISGGPTDYTWIY